MTEENETAAASEERAQQLGFKPQKEIIYNKLLPYADELDVESNALLERIRTNLGRAVLLRELHPGCSVWTTRLLGYIELYGLKFSKEDHIALVNLLYELLTIPNLDSLLLLKFSKALYTLLKKRDLLSPEDITLDWRPLYDLLNQTLDSNYGLVRYYAPLEQALVSLVLCAKPYFPDTATREILDTLMPQFTDLSWNNSDSMKLLSWFLPVSLPPEKAHLGYKLWLPDFMQMWEKYNNNPSWEPQLMKLVANLASNNVGLIDWEPYIPIMFTRFLRSLNLPITYKKLQTSKASKTDMYRIALWIVSVLDRENSCQKYLDKFLKTIESYYHPANFGVWFLKLKDLLSNLPRCFLQRLFNEREKRYTWETPVPEERKLTEDDIDRFVESMKAIAMQAVFSKYGSTDAANALQNLATLRPKVIIPPLIERFYATLSSVTEPHKLTSVMSCVAMVARPMVQGGTSGYPEGPTHVIPLLMSILPGIDANDLKKSFVTIQFILMFMKLVPLADSSRASEHWTDLTQEEEAICAASANFEDFVVNFFDRIFSFVENMSLEFTRMEKDNEMRSKVENLVETVITSGCHSVLNQCSADIFKTALNKLKNFVRGRILEPKVAGSVVATVCKAFSLVNPRETLECLLPDLCATVTSLAESEDVRKNEVLDEELHYNLLLLSELVDCRRDIGPFVPRLLDVVDRTLALSSRDGFVTGSKVLCNILLSLTTVGPLEVRTHSEAYDAHVKDYLPIRDWGKPVKMQDVNIRWHVPGEAERKCVEDIVRRYLPAELDRIDGHVRGDAVLSRTDLLRSLNVVLVILGAHSMLPAWEEEPLPLVKSAVDLEPCSLALGVNGVVSLPDGSNVRLAIARTIDRLQRKMLASLGAEDDTKSLFAIIQIWKKLLSNNPRNQSDFESCWKVFKDAKNYFGNPLVKKNRMRIFVIDRTILQHICRMENARQTLTETHRTIMLNLLELSCNQYSKVRMNAQSALFSGLVMSPFSHLILIPQLLENLKLNPTENHERFKGSLYVLSGPKLAPLIARSDWEVLDLWHALVRSSPSEKPSVVNLLEGLMLIVQKTFPTVAITVEVPDACLDRARTYLGPASGSVTQTDVDNGRKTLEDRCLRNRDAYLNHLNSLLETVQTRNLHWRYCSMALRFLRDLAHPDIPYPAGIVKMFLHALVNDSLEIRKIAINTTLFLLVQQKREKKKVTADLGKLSGCPVPENPRPGLRPDNLWLQYDSARAPRTREQWDEVRYVHKEAFGYFQWPKDFEIHAASSEQPSVDRDPATLGPEEREVYDFFTNPGHVARLVEFLSLEEKKGKDKFNLVRYGMFKHLFRNHGDVFLTVFRSHLERLVADDHESSQRCATEIIGGILRGSKHWPFEKVAALWDFLGPLIRTGLSNMTEETVRDWIACFGNVLENVDPNRYHWLLEILMENPFMEKSSFLAASRLFILSGVLHKQGWKVIELSKRLIDYIKPNLSHPFQNVRERIACLLTCIFEVDGSLVDGPRPEPFMRSVAGHLYVPADHGSNPVSLDKFGEGTDVSAVSAKLRGIRVRDGDDDNEPESDSSEKEVALKLMKTVCAWMSETLGKSHNNVLPEFYLIFPLVCTLENYEQDEELCRLCSHVVRSLAKAAILPEHIPTVLTLVKKVIGFESWLARSSAVAFFEVFLFHNMFLILRDDRLTRDSTGLVLDLLEDSRVEVREKAAEVMGGLLHCGFISNTDELLKHFVKKSKMGSNRKSLTENSDALRLRHSGILGLCAFINSSPYDVPNFVPEIIFILRDHLNDPLPISSTIRKTLTDFKRTHHDDWDHHQLKFTERQLEVFSEINVPPSCYT